MSALRYGQLMALGNGSRSAGPWSRPGYDLGTGAGSRTGTGLDLRLAAAEVSPDIIGVDPSAVMREMATAWCASLVAEGLVARG